MTDAGKVLDAVRALRRLLAEAESASYVIESLGEAGAGLEADLDQLVTRAVAVLEELEATEAYRAARKEYLSNG